MRIVVDPGHGGHDPGAVDLRQEEAGDLYDTREDDINLAIGLLLKDCLEVRGHEVRMTRETDVYPTLTDRARLANRWPADLFISVHCNASTNEEARGVETLIYSETSAAAGLAKKIQKQLAKATDFRDRGVKVRPDVYVLRKTSCPALLIECGFLTNTEEEAALNERLYHEAIATAVAGAIGEA
jgi:N-acetylmuramoyl-L-alanine amidase